MSFAALDLEAQNGPQPEPENPADLAHVIRNTSSQIQSYASLISTFANERRLIGTRRDTPQLRAKLDESQANIQRLGEAVQSLIGQISVVVNAGGRNSPGAERNSPGAERNDSQKDLRGQLMMKDRIVGEFNALQGTFRTQTREYAGAKRAHALPETTPLLQDQTPAQSQEPVPAQVQAQLEQVDESELQYHVLLTEERNRQIEQVQDGIREVNSIFKDLGDLVNSQGAQLDTVEENILQMSGNAHSADRELTKANEYQKRKNKWSCILLCALCVFVLVLVLAVVS